MYINHEDRSTTGKSAMISYNCLSPMTGVDSFVGRIEILNLQVASRSA